MEYPDPSALERLPDAMLGVVPAEEQEMLQQLAAACSVRAQDPELHAAAKEAIVAFLRHMEPLKPPVGEFQVCARKAYERRFDELRTAYTGFRWNGEGRIFLFYEILNPDLIPALKELFMNHVPKVKVAVSMADVLFGDVADPEPSTDETQAVILDPNVLVDGAGVNM